MADWVVKKMRWSNKDFTVDEINKEIHVKDRSNGKDTGKAVSDALDGVTEDAIRNKKFSTVLHDKPSEKYLIEDAPYRITFQRFATPLFGFTAVGTYLTAYKYDIDGSIMVWVSCRGAEVLDPNKLDMTAAGGVVAGDTPWDSILKEAREEASLPKEVVEHAKATERITYAMRHQDTGLIYFCINYGYDLELSEMTPTPGNFDEVAWFKLMRVEEILKALRGRKFRDGASLCMIDFLRRHNIITGKEVDELERQLHSALPVEEEK
jgi:hypothetical protein